MGLVYLFPYLGFPRGVAVWPFVAADSLPAGPCIRTPGPCPRHGADPSSWVALRILVLSLLILLRNCCRSRSFSARKIRPLRQVLKDAGYPEGVSCIARSYDVLRREDARHNLQPLILDMLRPCV